MTSADGSIQAAPKRRWLSRGYLVTMGTVLSLATGLGLTVLGLGSADQAVASYDAASWVWSAGKGELARINGITARVDTRVAVPKVRDHKLEISQNDRFVLLRDATTGAIGSMDLATLKEFWGAQPTAGQGVSVALQGDAAFVIDTVQGQVQQIDPRTLAQVGQPMRFPPGLTGGVFDGKGRLWIASPSEGTVTAITPAPLASDAPTQGGTTAAGPQLERTESVAPASHDLRLSALNDGVAVLNRTTYALTTVLDDQSKPTSTTLPLAGPGTLATHTDGTTVPVTVADNRHVYVVDDRGGMKVDFPVPGTGTDLQPAVAWQGYYYVADNATGTVHVFDDAGVTKPDIGFRQPGGPLELEVREGYLFINAPGSSTARVVDDAHTVRTVDKYANDVFGGDPPPVPPAPPTPPIPHKPPRPVIAKPGAPQAVRAEAGNAQARLTWRPAAANGAPITRYVVVGAGKTFEVGADQRSLTVPNLINGQSYEFAVHAVNQKGDGPPRTSNTVRPTSEVPDAPTAVTAEAKPDGTVQVTWPAANGQGLAIKQYSVTAISDGGSAPIGAVTDGTSLTIPDGQLTYGKQYAFTVIAVNEHGAGSAASPVSASIVPFNKPGKPDPVSAATVSNQAGAIKVDWQAAPDNGRPITKYVVTAMGTTTEVTAGTTITLTGFAAGVGVTVEVKAVNEAGEGQAGSATAQTVAAPRLTITNTTVTYNTATVGFSVDAGGGTATCSLTAPNIKAASGSCSSLKVSGLKPSTAYTFTVSAQNVAGTVTATSKKTTADLYGTATCINGDSGDQLTYCNANVPGRNGNEIFSDASQQSKQVGWAENGTRLKAYCKVLNAEEIDSYVYNNHKKSTIWIMVDYSGKNYIPFAWFNLDGGDKTTDLPEC